MTTHTTLPPGLASDVALCVLIIALVVYVVARWSLAYDPDDRDDDGGWL